MSLFFRFLVLSLLIPFSQCYGFDEYQHLNAKLRDRVRPGNPVVIVPGDGASRIEAKLTGKLTAPHRLCAKNTNDYFTLWLDIYLLGKFVVDCTVDSLKLVFDPKTGLSSDAPGVETRVPSSVESLEYLDIHKYAKSAYFAHIVEELEKWGYTKEKDIIAAPYDWRRAPHELIGFYDLLRTRIEKTYSVNDNKPVVIVGHSLGNPVMLYFYTNVVSADWKQKFIKSHVSLGAPWAGAAQIIRMYTTGYNLNQFQVVLAPGDLLPMERTLTSSAFLFPSRAVWGPTEPYASFDGKNYTVSNIGEFFEDIGYPIGMAQYNWTQYKGVSTLDPPGVEIHCVYGTGVKTPEKFEWSKNGYWSTFPKSSPTEVHGDGDGTVNLKSLQACKRWNAGNNGGKQVKTYEVSGADHIGILKEQVSMSVLKDVLYRI
ncbi:hypothetical protein L596_015420 [Steinernema carpocapsae]|uniref:Uncharacterized protein n=1 Tax=Steinernema carpocapsae TaxID=34508 RepID=A0A4U5NEX8_STECR|nr:hypothetical protein L596_015420 [Steinernema carpocapsae]